MGKRVAKPAASLHPLSRDFFAPLADVVAPRLLGCVIRSVTEEGAVAVRLTEVEAYAGVDGDPASHAHRGQTKRNAPMFDQAGTLYVYFTYGMHWCVNLVCGPIESASAVLLRAGEVTEGVALATKRRPQANGAVDLARGPAKLASVLGLNGSSSGLDVFAGDSPVVLFAGEAISPAQTVSGPRVGIAQGRETLWRFWLSGESTVSRFR
ncbi:MAG: DNA-3-methyladenine glycosylase [Candidatus Nanopelagicales bacterium]